MTEKYYVDKTNCEVLTESDVREQYKLIKTVCPDYPYSFSDFLEASCKHVLNEISSDQVFDACNGYNAGAVLQYSNLLDAMISSGKTSGNIEICVDGIKLLAPNTAALLQGLQQAVADYAEDIL